MAFLTIYLATQRQVLAAGRTGKTPSPTRTIASKAPTYHQGEALSATHNVGWLLAKSNLAIYTKPNLIRLSAISTMVCLYGRGCQPNTTCARSVEKAYFH
jgi:hypothetical protein